MPGFNRRSNLLKVLHDTGHWASDAEMRQAIKLAAVKLLHAEMDSVLFGDAQKALDVIEFYGQFDTLKTNGSVEIR